VPFAARPVLALASVGFASLNAALLGGAFVAVLILFSVRVTLLGCVSPFVIRLAMQDPRERGPDGWPRLRHLDRRQLHWHVSARPGADSGDRHAQYLRVALIVSAGGRTGGLARSQRRRLWAYLWMPIVIVVLALLARGQPVKTATNTIYETESAYNYIQVVERGGCRLLLLNEGEGIHSVYCPGQGRVGGPWDTFLIAPFFNPPPYTSERRREHRADRAGGRHHRAPGSAAYGPLAIDGVEIDPEIVRVGASTSR